MYYNILTAVKDDGKEHKNNLNTDNSEYSQF